MKEDSKLDFELRFVRKEGDQWVVDKDHYTHVEVVFIEEGQEGRKELYCQFDLPERLLQEDARVGAFRFRKGVAERLVLERAIRENAIYRHPDPDDLPPIVTKHISFWAQLFAGFIKKSGVEQEGYDQWVENAIRNAVTDLPDAFCYAHESKDPEQWHHLGNKLLAAMGELYGLFLYSYKQTHEGRSLPPLFWANVVPLNPPEE